MEENVLKVFHHYNEVAFFISIMLNIIIALLALIPSFFLTAGNILFFGFWEGTLLSYIGEVFGAVISFWLYRKGLKNFSRIEMTNSSFLLRLLTIKGKDAFFLIISLRILPFVPSGVVTFMSAIGMVSLTTFTFASSIGKAPALLMEAYSVYQVANWTDIGKLILAIISIFSTIFLYIKTKKGV